MSILAVGPLGEKAIFLLVIGECLQDNFLIMKMRALPLLAFALAPMASCTRQPVIDLGLLSERITALEEKHDGLQKEISSERQKLTRISSEREVIARERFAAQKELGGIEESLKKIAAEFAHYKSEYRQVAKTRVRGMRLPQIQVGLRTYRDVLIREASDIVLSFTHSDGLAKVDIASLGDDLRNLLGYDADSAAGLGADDSSSIVADAISDGQRAADAAIAYVEKKEAPKPKPQTHTVAAVPYGDRPGYFGRTTLTGPSNAPYASRNRRVGGVAARSSLSSGGG
jgi:hypothetical protein